MIAALFVQAGGAYYAPELAGLVDPWPESRDARLYAGPWPVVAHPPCARWCRLAALVEARWGHLRGEDGGTFASALASVRRWGGVLEHPAWSDAWAAHDLPAPPTGGGWARDTSGGWSCHVEQGRYGHPAKKATWLYYVGSTPPPSLRWGHVSDQRASALASWRGNHTRARVGGYAGNGVHTDHDTRERLSSKRASSTPPAFRDVLLDLARRSAQGRAA